MEKARSGLAWPVVDEQVAEDDFLLGCQIFEPGPDGMAEQLGKAFCVPFLFPYFIDFQFMQVRPWGIEQVNSTGVGDVLQIQALEW